MVFVGDKVMVAGDWHGDSDWGINVVTQTASEGISTILHLGDFGFWPGDWGANYLKRLESALKYWGVTIAVTPGNHEDWDRLDMKKTKDKDDGWGEVKHMTDHIIVLPRAYRTELEYSGGSRSLVSLGGAPSIDFVNRSEGRSWWKSEMITQADVDATIAGGHADIMLAHDSPDAPWCAPAVEEIIYNPNSVRFWGAPGVKYAEEGRKLMHEAYEGVMPKVFFHGHFHVYSSRTHEHGAVWALPDQRQGGNAVTLDLATLKVN